MSVDSSSSPDRTSNAISDGSQVSGNAYQAKNMHFGARSTGITLIAFAGVVGLTFLGFTIAGSEPAGGSPPAAADAPKSPTASTSASPPPSSLTPSPSTPAASAPAAHRSSELAQARPSGGAAGAAPTATTDGSTTQCRSHTPTSIGGIATANPCIRIESNNKIYIYDNFTAQKTGQFTLFIWLIDGTGTPIRKYMQSCPINFKSIGERKACSLRGITPPGPGQWAAAVTAEAGTHTQPGLWDSPYKGTQSGAVVWDPADS
ncbi:hypothetical protein PV350_18890 [Streptomyces sp. PA03-6a]|nr:hypothetical protein [Streptomyces sp. PA03-6a]